MRILLPIFFILFSSCSQYETPHNIIPEDRFVEYYSDLLVVRQEGIMASIDSIGMQTRVDSLNRAYGVSPDQVKTTLQLYKNNFPRWRSFYERVMKRLETLQRPDTAKPSVSKM
ncbi:MAG: hypothetical protein HY033_02320 [Ignavibacteriae bacterium]|nr:hypothetical protein [Ignavibacteria bacterium]MBI3363723.1 hypothetical protein [Ignavibacteriota bacterium]